MKCLNQVCQQIAVFYRQYIQDNLNNSIGVRSSEKKSMKKI